MKKISIFFGQNKSEKTQSDTDTQTPVLSLQTGADLTQIRQLIRHLWLRYAIAVILVAGLSVASYLIVIGLNLMNENNGQLIQASAQQLTLAEQAGRLALRLTMPLDADEVAATRDRLQKILDELTAQHTALRDGKLEGSQIPEAVDIFSKPPYQLNSQFLVFENLTQSLNGMAEYTSGSLLATDAEQVSAAVDDLKPGLTALSQVYENAGVGKIYRVIEIETYVLLSTLLVLALEIVWIFRPTIGRVRQTALSLQQQSAFNQNIIATAQAFVIGLDLEGRIVLFNRYSEDKTGWSYAEVVGRHFAECFLPPEHHAAFIVFDQALPNDTQIFEYDAPCLTRDGRILQTRWHTTRVREPNSGKLLLQLVTGVDLTDLKAAAQSLETALHEARTLSERLQEEVSHAALLQRSLLPPPSIDLPGIKGSAILTTCTEVGGDYYDYYSVDDRHAVIIVADASGHGVAAGTLVSSAKIAVRHLAERGETNPAQILAFINHALLTNTHDSMFMTMGCLSLDTATGQLRYASAGHVYPYIRSQQGNTYIWHALENSGIPLGRVADIEYLNITTEIAPGDRLFLYTDGLVEERSTGGEMLGFERLEQMLEDYGAMSCDETIYWLQNELEQFHGSNLLSDDATLLMIDYTHRSQIGYEIPLATLKTGEGAVLRLHDSAYRLGKILPDPHISRQYTVFLADAPFNDLLPRFCYDGIRRVIVEESVATRALGLPQLLGQHHTASLDDLYRLIGKCTVQRQFVITHSEEKDFIQMEIAGLLQGCPQLDGEHIETLQLVLDELFENALYGAPRDLGNRPLYAKATEREVALSEGVRLDFAINDNWLGLMVTDSWGTLTPAVFLQRLALNSQLRGLQAGLGGAGIFLVWLLADYLQVRVLPRQKTQVTALWHLAQKPDPDASPSFQFLYHTEADEFGGLEEQDAPFLNATDSIEHGVETTHLEELC